MSKEVILSSKKYIIFECNSACEFSDPFSDNLCCSRKHSCRQNISRWLLASGSYSMCYFVRPVVRQICPRLFLLLQFLFHFQFLGLILLCWAIFSSVDLNASERRTTLAIPWYLDWWDPVYGLVTHNQINQLGQTCNLRAN